MVDELVAEWLRLDVFDPRTREEIEGLKAAGKDDELRGLLGSRMAFGTAGLRARMGAGFSRMNVLTIVQTTQGLAEYLLQQDGEAKSKGVCIGYDARHNSTMFAKAAAAVFRAKGFTVTVFSQFVMTPMVPFTVVKEGMCCGVMVTASHNPKEDNGFKVYWGNGCQIIPPHDHGIAASIEANLEPVIGSSDVDAVDLSAQHHATATLVAQYMAAIKADLFVAPKQDAKELVVTYTAMHGIGHRYIKEVFNAFSLSEPVPVPEQVEPDPEFPTVRLPNPEEGKGALTLAMRTAEKAQSNLILANDPDADRLAVAERDPSSGEWHIFKGDEIGVLLAHWQLTNSSVKRGDIAMLTTAVSSKMLRALCDKEGLIFEETLTGFKWLGNRALDHQKEGRTVLLAYEEAIGFMLSRHVPDKDGVSAAAVFAQMANSLASEGVTVKQHLQKLRESYGFFATQNHYFICNDQGTIDAIFARLRENGKYASECGGFKIRAVRDLTTGVDTNYEDGKARLPVSASSHMITYTFENGCVVTLRTSGTEPKIKYYCELSSSESMEAAKEELSKIVEAVIKDFLQPEKNHLQ